MVLAFSEDLQTGLSLRISRYPDQGVTWVWCHAISRGRFLAYSDSHLSCGPAHNEADAGSADYGAPDIGLRMHRDGASADLHGIRFGGTFLAHASHEAPEGPGDVRLSLSGEFRPDKQAAGALPGRYEQTGQVILEMETDGETTLYRGLGKAHEQTQTTPRFGPAFTYVMLWGPDSSLIGLSAGGRGRGEFIAPDGRTAVESLDIGPRGTQRRLEAKLAGGGKLAVAATSAHAFTVPVFGRRWCGSMVSADVGGRPMVGMINDWPGLG